MSLIVDEHRQYLTDAFRIAAFRRAIQEVVTPGDIVLDLGCGTGILGLLACQAGAKRVYAVDEGGMIQLAREICRANQYQDRIVHLQGFSTRIDLPEPVDVVVADQIGRFGIEAGVFEYYSDARARFLKPGGKLIPCRIDLCVAPIESEDLWNQVAFWSRSQAGFDVSAASPLAANTGYPAKYHPRQLLGQPAMLASLDPSTAPPAIVGLETTLRVTRSGSLSGIGGWFSAQLSAGVAMSNSPLGIDSIDRHGVFFPLNRPVEVVDGDEVRVRMDVMPAQTIVTWQVEVQGTADDGQRQSPMVCKAQESHSTFQGMLLSSEGLKKTRPNFVPRLTPWGEARLSVLSLCDGKRVLADVEQEFYCRHPTLFRSHEEASRFVAEVVTPYAL